MLDKIFAFHYKICSRDEHIEIRDLLPIMNHRYYISIDPKKEKFFCSPSERFKDIEFFNPKLKRKSLAHGWVLKVEEVLSPNYVSPRFNPLTCFHLIKYTNRLKRIVCDSERNPYSVDPAIITEIKA